MRKVSVLRLGHRYPRDARVSTHLSLVAWSFGADELLYTGDKDPELEAKIRSTVSSWGGDFRIIHIPSYREVVKRYRGNGYTVVHLTMYGVNINHVMDILMKREKHLVIVGGEKVPRDVYELADYNVAIGWLPHSEIAALAVYLDRIFMGNQLENRYCGRRSIVSMKHGKKVVECDDLNL